jgi:hypothetical protein
MPVIQTVANATRAIHAEDEKAKEERRKDQEREERQAGSSGGTAYSNPAFEDARGQGTPESIQHRMEAEGLPLEAPFTKLLSHIFTAHFLNQAPAFAKYFKAEAAQLEASTASGSKASPGAEAGHSYRGAAGGAREPTIWARWRVSPLRRNIYLTVSHPEHSRLAMFIGVFIMSIVILNTITFCVESVPHYETGETLYVCCGDSIHCHYLPSCLH